jgi:transposase-like protein
MSTKNKCTSDFKKTIVNLYHFGKTYGQIHNEYGISTSALSKWTNA